MLYGARKVADGFREVAAVEIFYPPAILGFASLEMRSASIGKSNPLGKRGHVHFKGTIALRFYQSLVQQITHGVGIRIAQSTP